MYTIAMMKKTFSKYSIQVIIDYIMMSDANIANNIFATIHEQAGV